MAKQKSIPVFLILAFAAALVVGGYFLTRGAFNGRVQDLLHSYGFEQAVTGTKDHQKGMMIYGDITLDEDHFSTIKAIRFKTGYLDRILNKQPQDIVIDDIKLIADYTPETGFHISGRENRPLPFPPYQNITLHGGQIDIDTPAGGLRFQAKGIAQQQADRALKINAALWGIQNQLKIETTWDATLYPDGRWSAEATIENGGLNLERIQASRVSGWVALDKTENAFPAISGQLDSGKITIGAINFMNSRLTFEGTAALYKIIAKGEIAEFPGMTALIDLENTVTGLQIKASIDSTSADDLVAFLALLQNSDQDTGYLTSLLLTPGNIERLRKDLRQLSYDRLELQIYGAPYDLAGKVIAHRLKNGITQKYVVSLDPGTP